MGVLLICVLQGEAIETLRKLKSGLGDLLSPGSTDKGIKNNNSAGNTEDLIAKDVKENVGEVNVNGEVDFYTKIDQAGFDIKVDVNAQPIELKLSNGVRIQAEAGKTTTVLGKYQYIDGSGTGEVLELTNYPGTYDFGPKEGGFNVLNIPSRAANPIYEQGQFFDSYNKPFLDAAVSRGDNIALTTIPNRDNIQDFISPTGQPIGMFGMELQYLITKNYKPSNINDELWTLIKRGFKE